MKKFIVSIAIAGGLAFASVGAASAGDKPSNPNKLENCAAVIAKQTANGQTGANTGSANDEKQLDTAVANCDGFWQAFGSN